MEPIINNVRGPIFLIPLLNIQIAILTKACFGQPIHRAIVRKNVVSYVEWNVATMAVGAQVLHKHVIWRGHWDVFAENFLVVIDKTRSRSFFG
jgi:hypothetical protein